MPQLVNTLFSVGPGLAAVSLSSSSSSADSNFVFRQCKIEYGYNSSLFFPANTAHPMLLISEPKGVAEFYGIVTDSKFLSNLAENLTPQNASGNSITITYTICKQISESSNSSGTGGSSNTSNSSSNPNRTITLTTCFAEKYQIIGESREFIFLEALVVTFFRLDVS
jgi:hypothetical protein